MLGCFRLSRWRLRPWWAAPRPSGDILCILVNSLSLHLCFSYEVPKPACTRHTAPIIHHADSDEWPATRASLLSGVKGCAVVVCERSELMSEEVPCCMTVRNAAGKKTSKLIKFSHKNNNQQQHNHSVVSGFIMVKVLIKNILIIILIMTRL